MHALGRLIADVMAAQGMNQAELARRAGMNRNRIGQLLKDPVKRVPRKATIVGLARGLGVPPWVVMDAVLESLDLPTRPTHITVDEAVRADPGFDASSKRALLAFVAQLRSPDLSGVQGHRVDTEAFTRRDTPSHH